VPKLAPRAAASTHPSVARMSRIEGNAGDTSTTSRTRLSAQTHNTSGEDTSDTDVAPQGKVSNPERLNIRTPPSRFLRKNPSRKKLLWRVVQPPTSRVLPTQRLAAPSLRPRVWTGVRRSLISMHVPLLIPRVAEQRRAVRCTPCSCKKRERCRMGASPIPCSHILWGGK
jgi:hypothetical protein